MSVLTSGCSEIRTKVEKILESSGKAVARAILRVQRFANPSGCLHLRIGQADTNSANFPTASPLYASNAGGYDAFVTKLTPDGSGFVYSTYLGGSGTDSGAGIAVDSSGSAYITGNTNSVNFPPPTRCRGPTPAVSMPSWPR